MKQELLQFAKLHQFLLLCTHSPLPSRSGNKVPFTYPTSSPILEFYGIMNSSSWIILPSPPQPYSIKNTPCTIISKLLSANVLESLPPLKIIINSSVTQQPPYSQITQFTATWIPFHCSIQTALIKLRNKFHISKSNNPF